MPLKALHGPELTCSKACFHLTFSLSSSVSISDILHSLHRTVSPGFDNSALVLYPTPNPMCHYFFLHHAGCPWAITIFRWFLLDPLFYRCSVCAILQLSTSKRWCQFDVSSPDCTLLSSPWAYHRYLKHDISKMELFLAGKIFLPSYQGVIHSGLLVTPAHISVGFWSLYCSASSHQVLWILHFTFVLFYLLFFLAQTLVLSGSLFLSFNVPMSSWGIDEKANPGAERYGAQYSAFLTCFQVMAVLLVSQLYFE